MQPRVAFVGEAWGADEEEAFRETGIPTPFVGAAGRLLDGLLKVAALDRSACLITNVFNMRPKDNDLADILVGQKEGAEGWPPIRRGLYLPPRLLPELARLYGELEDFKPSIIIALGSTALWSLCGKTGIANRHGFLHSWRSIPVVPTYHPASITRKYTQFMPAANDILRAVGYATGTIQAESFAFCDQPTLADIRDLRDLLCGSGLHIAVDIETKPKFRSITCIGIGTADHAVSINFWDPAAPSQSYWPTAAEELEALGLVAEILQDPSTTKVLQNAAYDITWIKTIWGIDIAGPVLDTRLMHFALFPELPHSLAEIASTWLMMPPWKALHSFGSKEGDQAPNTLED
jgi:uracil-DNA glycosylase